jgi:exoribonuclease-2
MEILKTLAQLAKQVMELRGLQPDFSKEELQQVSQMHTPAPLPKKFKDLRDLLWCSIDNDDSLDLDQLTYGEKNHGMIDLWIAIADVDSLVKKNSPVDNHAQINTTSVYTPAKIFAMLPEKLSTDLTSLNENEDRNAVVVQIQIDQAGEIQTSSIFQAVVQNHAKLAYNSVGAWLEGKTPLPDNIKKVQGLDNALQIQHEAAQILRKRRQRMGSLSLAPAKTEVKVSSNNQIVFLPPTHNFAHQLIEELMVAANRTMADLFKEQKIASLRRVVRKPKYWDHIVELARDFGEELPRNPDAKALDAFLLKRQKQDPDSFPDLSLTVVKLMGRGEYIVENIGDTPVGHFALAITEYTHSTAPNRRFPDLISQRQCKAFLQGLPTPYSAEELSLLAAHCTQQEDAATKVERHLNKSAAALFFSSHIGTFFPGIISGVNENGVWARVFHPSVEGKVVQGSQNLSVGQKVSLKLVYVDIQKGFIDFEAIKI